VWSAVEGTSHLRLWLRQALTLSDCRMTATRTRATASLPVALFVFVSNPVRPLTALSVDWWNLAGFPNGQDGSAVCLIQYFRQAQVHCAQTADDAFVAG